MIKLNINDFKRDFFIARISSNLALLNQNNNSLPCTVRTSKDWLSIGRIDTLHTQFKTQIGFQDAWRGLEPEATPSPPRGPIVVTTNIKKKDLSYHSPTSFNSVLLGNWSCWICIPAFLRSSRNLYLNLIHFV